MTQIIMVLMGKGLLRSVAFLLDATYSAWHLEIHYQLSSSKQINRASCERAISLQQHKHNATELRL
jgi:hypothetical protein